MQVCRISLVGPALAPSQSSVGQQIMSLAVWTHPLLRLPAFSLVPHTCSVVRRGTGITAEQQSAHPAQVAPVQVDVAGHLGPSATHLCPPLQVAVTDHGARARQLTASHQAGGVGMQREEAVGAGDKGSPGGLTGLLRGQLTADTAVYRATHGSTLEDKPLSALDTGQVVLSGAGFVAAGGEVPLYGLAEEALSGGHGTLGTDKGWRREVGDPETPTVILGSALGTGDEELAVFVTDGALAFFKGDRWLDSFRLFR